MITRRLIIGPRAVLATFSVSKKVTTYGVNFKQVANTFLQSIYPPGGKSTSTTHLSVFTAADTTLLNQIRSLEIIRSLYERKFDLGSTMNRGSITWKSNNRKIAQSCTIQVI